MDWKLNPMFGAAAMSLSSFCVVTNALRLKSVFPCMTGKRDKKMKRTTVKQYRKKRRKHNGKNNGNRGNDVRTLRGKSEEMHWRHCPRWRRRLVSHEAGTAVVKLNAEVADDVLKKAVEDQDYEVTGIC